MNLLEAQLRSWTPRRPSAKLERRLFGRPEPRAEMSALANLLAPAAACAALALTLLQSPGPTAVSTNPARATLAAMSLSNQNYAAYLPGSFRCEANRLDTFGWTTGAGSNSPMGSLTPARVND